MNPCKKIFNLQVTHWDKTEYGKFYNGDSYIILNTYKEKDTEVRDLTLKQRLSIVEA